MSPNNVLAKFVDIICIFFYTHYPYFMYHCTEYPLSALQVRILEKNKLKATTQQHITAKVSGCACKPGSKTYSSLHQNNSQLQNEAALMSCRIRAVEHRKGAAGHAGAPRFARSNLAKLHKNWECTQSTQVNFLFFVMYRSPANFLFSFFPTETLSNSWKLLQYVEKSCFWARATVLSCYRTWYCSHCDQRLRFFRLNEFFYPLLASLGIGAGVEQPFGCLIVQNRQAV